MIKLRKLNFKTEGISRRYHIKGAEHYVSMADKKLEMIFQNGDEDPDIMRAHELVKYYIFRAKDMIERAKCYEH